MSLELDGGEVAVGSCWFALDGGAGEGRESREGEDGEDGGGEGELHVNDWRVSEQEERDVGKRKKSSPFAARSTHDRKLSSRA